MHDFYKVLLLYERQLFVVCTFISIQFGKLTLNPGSEEIVQTIFSIKY